MTVIRSLKGDAWWYLIIDDNQEYMMYPEFRLACKFSDKEDAGKFLVNNPITGFDLEIEELM